MPSSTHIVSNFIPSTSATYSAPYDTQCGTMGAVLIYQQYGWPPMYSSKPQIHIPRGGSQYAHVGRECNSSPSILRHTW